MHNPILAHGCCTFFLIINSTLGSVNTLLWLPNYILLVFVLTSSLSCFYSEGALSATLWSPKIDPWLWLLFPPVGHAMARMPNINFLHYLTRLFWNFHLVVGVVALKLLHQIIHYVAGSNHYFIKSTTFVSCECPIAQSQATIMVNRWVLSWGRTSWLYFFSLV